MSHPPVTLQISLAPSDHRLAEWLLPHQLRAWRGSVAEILLTIDTRRSRGRFGLDWEEGRRRILALAYATEGVRVLEVDYGVAAREAVAAAFFEGRAVPQKDCRGGPYYAYFFGLRAAAHDHVLHSDADMFFGGNAGQWLGEALAEYEKNPQILFTAPLPGPPSADGALRQLHGVRLPGATLAYRFPEMSTRLFLFDRRRFHDRIGGLQPRRPAWRACLRALLDGNPMQELPEVLLSSAMTRAGLERIDFLGSPPGCWSLHPPYRCTDFFAKLPGLARRVELGDLPAAQLGDHDINDSLVNWSEAREQMARGRWWHRLAARLAGNNR
jgi:hypothetical protein